MEIKKLLYHGNSYDYVIAAIAVVTGFFSTAFLPSAIGPWLYCSFLIYFGRTADITSGNLIGVLILLQLLVNGTGFLLDFWAPVIGFLHIPFLALAIVFDRFIFHGFYTWTINKFKSASLKTSHVNGVVQLSWGLRLVEAFRTALTLLFFPLTYVALYSLVDFLPSPLNISGISNMALATSSRDLQMLAAIGGLPLISFTITLFATTLVTLVLSFQIQFRGSVKTIRNEYFPQRDSIESSGSCATQYTKDQKLYSTFPDPSSPTLYSAFPDSPLPNDSQYYNGSLIQDVRGSQGATITPMGSYSKIPYNQICSSIRYNTRPWIVLVVALILTGPFIRIFFDGHFFHTSFAEWNDGFDIAKMACVPDEPKMDDITFDRLVREAQYNEAQLIITSEYLHTPLVQSDIALEQLSDRYNMMIGQCRNIDGHNEFSLTGKNDPLFKHTKFNRVPLESLKTRPPYQPSIAKYDNFISISPTQTLSYAGNSNFKHLRKAKAKNTINPALIAHDNTADENPIDKEKLIKTKSQPIEEKSVEELDDESNDEEVQSIKDKSTREENRETKSLKDIGAHVQNFDNKPLSRPTTLTAVPSPTTPIMSTPPTMSNPTTMSTPTISIPFTPTPINPITPTKKSKDTFYDSVKIGGAIGSDNYNALQMAHAGRDGVDLMLVPGSIWKSLYRAHRAMIKMRAIENGYVVFTCTKDGQSGVYGPFGEVYGEGSSVAGSPLVIFSGPVRPQKRAFHFFRVYPFFADRLCWFCIASWLIVGLLSLCMPSK